MRGGKRGHDAVAHRLDFTALEAVDEEAAAREVLAAHLHHGGVLHFLAQLGEADDVSEDDGEDGVLAAFPGAEAGLQHLVLGREDEFLDFVLPPGEIAEDLVDVDLGPLQPRLDAAEQVLEGDRLDEKVRPRRRSCPVAG